MSSDKDFYYKKSRLKQIQGFCSVVQNESSIAKAAIKTNMEQTTISKQISSLERDLGVNLFDRSQRNRLKITREGELFYEDAVKQLNGLNSLFDNFNEKLKDFNNNNLSIALHQIAATFIFPPILEKMLKLEEFKKLQINIYSISKDEAIKKLIDKEIDLAFYINVPKEKIPTEIDITKSMQSQVSLVFNKYHPLANKKIITKDDLERYKFLKKNVETKSYSNIYGHFNTKLSNIRTIGASFDTILEIIKRTDNMSTVPNLFLNNNCSIDSEVESRNIDDLLDEAFFHVMTLKNSTITKPKLWLINEFKKLAQKN